MLANVVTYFAVYNFDQTIAARYALLAMFAQPLLGAAPTARLTAMHESGGARAVVRAVNS
jgi:hypothetical protein